MASPQRISQWVLLAQVGNRAALDQLLKWIQGPLHRYLSKLLHDANRADDLLQDVLLRICRKLRSLRDPSLFQPWCFRIATREAFKDLKRRRIFASAEAMEMLAAPEDEPPPDKELIARMLDELNSVSPASRAVLLLHYLESMPLADVAAALSIPIGTAKSRLAYGLKVLRSKLDDIDLT